MPASLNLPMSAAARSRAMPWTPAQSERLGVIDLDQRIVEPGPLRVVGADRRILGQFDDAFVIVRKLQLEFRHQHAAALYAANGADLQGHVLARNVSARRHEHAFHAGARIGRAAYHLDRCARANVDHADPQPIGVRMLLRLDHAGDDEGRERFASVLDALDLKPDHGELVENLAERLIGIEVLFQPRQGEFHHGVTRSSRPRASESRAGGSRSVKASARRLRRRRGDLACRI